MLGACLVGAAVMLSGAKKIVDGLPSTHSVKTKYLSWFYPQPSSDEGDEDVSLHEHHQTLHR